jgi:RNA 3'-terminal phosphate cyclase (ATP)
MGDQTPIVLDGASGEGGGQILRTALSLSLHTGRPFRLTAIRANRDKPGLRPQHLLAVQSAQRLGGAYVEGAAVGSRELWFEPKQPATSGSYFFDIGTAGSTLLVLQTLLPSLLAAAGPSTLTLCGGTHNVKAPPYEFVERVFLPRLMQLGHQVTMTLLRPGFYPLGGGKLTVTISPTQERHRLQLLDRAKVQAVTAEVLVSRLPQHVARREQATLCQQLGLPERACRIRNLTDCHGPGNAVLVQIDADTGPELFCAIGERGVPAEQVATQCADEVSSFLAAEVPVGEHLADQLLLPLALAQGGSYLTTQPSLHTLTQVATIQAFLPVEITLQQQDSLVHLIRVAT